MATISNQQRAFDNAYAYLDGELNRVRRIALQSQRDGLDDLHRVYTCVADILERAIEPLDAGIRDLANDDDGDAAPQAYDTEQYFLCNRAALFALFDAMRAHMGDLDHEILDAAQRSARLDNATFHNATFLTQLGYHRRMVRQFFDAMQETIEG